MAAIGSATALIVFLPCSNSDLSRALNSSRGRSRKLAATRTRGSMAASVFAGLPSAPVNMASTARFSCSICFMSFLRGSFLPGFRERLGIGTLHARPQSAEGAELQLLHGTFGLANLPRHFFNAFLLHEPQHDYAPLFGGQRIDQTKQRRPAFHFFKFGAGGGNGIDQLRLTRYIFAALALPAVRNQIRGNAEQPRGERNPSPFKALQVGQRMMKHLGSYIFGLCAIVHPPHHVGVDSFEISLVKLAKARRVSL